MASAVGDLVVRFGADTSRFNRGAGQVTRMLGGLKGAAMGLAGALGFTGGVYGFVNLLRAGENFNQKMRQSLAIMGDVSDAMKGKMEKAAFDVAKATRFSAAEAAESYYFLASAGFDAAQSIAALPQVAKFAQAGNFDMARATDLATDAQSALGLTVKDATENLVNLTRVTDVLVKANTLANASTEQFSEALTTKSGAALRALGKDMEEGIAVLAAFADQGVKGSEAGTQLAIVLRDLQTKAIENKAAFTGAGIGVFDASGEMRNMADIIGDLEK
ncbi:MAG TPA: phage tail tape measure protein, partial [Thermoguttaceae bacterium]|nr:phage tail tape measure protein [Thermoguttaceae bacterium]